MAPLRREAMSQQLGLGHEQAPTQDSPSQLRRKREGDDGSDGHVEGNKNATQGQQQCWQQSKRRRCRVIGQAANECQHQARRQMKRLSSSPRDQMNGQAKIQLSGLIWAQASDKPDWSSSKDGQWTEHDLRRAIATALRSPFPGISAYVFIH